MQNFLDKVKEFFSNLWNKTSTIAKIIVGVAVLVVIILIIVLVSVSSRPDMVPLVQGSLSEGDYQRVQQELDARDIDYKANPSTRSIYVSSPSKAQQLRTELALDDKLQDKDGYELFDVQSFTTTEFDRSVKLQRSLVKSIELHLESIDEIENAEVEISFPKVDDNPLFLQDATNEQLTASVIITPSPGSEIGENKKRIKGIQNMVAKGVDRLETDNVHVFDHIGNELTATSEDEDSEYTWLLNMHKFRQTLIRDAKREIEGILKPIFDSYTIAVNTDVEREYGEKMEHKIEPITLQEDNPDTPSNESRVMEAVPISESTTNEKYRGQIFIPEGSPSPDFQFPPGAKQVSDQYNQYEQDSSVTNYEVSTSDSVRKDPAGDQLFVNASIAVDYEWEWERDPETNEIVEDPITRTRGRVYKPVSQEVLEDIRSQIQTYINRSNITNPGYVSVETFPFESTKQKHLKEDEEYFSAKDTQRVLLYTFIGLGILILLTLLFFWIRGIIRERRRRREEELARQRQAMREAALRAAEQEGVILDMSPEDKARLEMQENAIRLARERPEDVAKLLRTWISED